MAEEFVCCSAGIMHLFLVFVLSNYRLATFHKEVHDHRYRLFLEYKLTKLEWRVPAKLLSTIFCSKVSSVKCKHFGPEGAS